MTKCPSGADSEFYTFHTFQQHHNLNTGKLSTSCGLHRHVFSGHYVPIMGIAQSSTIQPQLLVVRWEFGDICLRHLAHSVTQCLF